MARNFRLVRNLNLPKPAPLLAYPIKSRPIPPNPVSLFLFGVSHIGLGNRIAEQDQEADLWDISDGLLAGVIQYWLYARQPCNDPMCEDCGPMSTAELRLTELRRLVDQFARESEYFHAPTDHNVGRA